MLKLKEDGYVYVSNRGIDRGIEYELLEGVSIGTERKYTSDIIFIVLNNAEYNVEDHIVGYLFGASVLEKDLMSYEESVKELVDDFEKKNFGINPIMEAIKQKIEMGYDKSQLEVDFGELDECEGYYLSKVNGWGTTPITPILAVEGDFEDKDLISELDVIGVFYNL